MISYKRKITYLSKQYSIDPDLIIVSLWDHESKKFKYLNSINDTIFQKDLKLAREIIEKVIHGDNENLGVVITSKLENKKECKDYDFNIGHIAASIHYLNKDDVLKIHEELVKDFQYSKDPIFPYGLKDEHMLDSAVLHQKTSYGEKLKYPTVESVAAALIYALSNNHPFHNGNKRTALVSLLVFLNKHNYFLLSNEHDLFKVSLKIADHKMSDNEFACCDEEVYEIAHWVNRNIKSIKKGEVPLTFKKLSQRLKELGCSIDGDGKITRLIERRSIFGRVKILVSKIPNDKPYGYEADKSLIKKIREDLQLDSSHGCDSDMFYGNISFSVDEFIEKYRNVLNRLSGI